MEMHLMKKRNALHLYGINSVFGIMKNLLLTYILLMINLLTACRHDFHLDKVVTLSHFASGSGIAFHQERLYLVGDDMNYMLVLDSELNIVDSLPLADSLQKRVPKETKQDIEAASVV